MTSSRALKVLILSSVVALSLAFLRVRPGGSSAPDLGIASPALQAAGGGSSGDQPLAFTHKAHIDSQMECMNCHEFADKSRHAGIPGVESCMSCHQAIKTESPEIVKLAEYQQRGEEVPWRRVYGFDEDSHVYFSHKRHIRAEVSCETCHGEIGKMQTAQRVVNHSMGWCVDCHRMNESKFPSPKLAVDCMTCHN